VDARFENPSSATAQYGLMSSLDTSWITARALAQPQPGRMSGQANAAHASHHETSRRHETSPGNEADDLRVRVLGPIDSGTNFVHAELTRAFAAAPRLRICSGGVARERAAPRTTCAPFVWKHTPPWRLRLSAAADRDFVFAMARDPLAWFVSVRKAPYILALNASAPLAGRCTLERKRTGDPLSPYSETFASLAEAWNSYYAGYAALRVPLVRYEDLVLRHGPTMDNLTAAARAHGRAAARAHGRLRAGQGRAHEAPVLRRGARLPPLVRRAPGALGRPHHGRAPGVRSTGAPGARCRSSPPCL